MKMYFFSSNQDCKSEYHTIFSENLQIIAKEFRIIGHIISQFCLPKWHLQNSKRLCQPIITYKSDNSNGSCAIRGILIETDISIYVNTKRQSDKHFFFQIVSIKAVCFYVGRMLEHIPYFAQGIFEMSCCLSLNSTQKCQSLAECQIGAG